MLIEHFFQCSHNGTHENIKVQLIGHCDPNDQEAREDFWISICTLCIHKVSIKNVD